MERDVGNDFKWKIYKTYRRDLLGDVQPICQDKHPRARRDLNPRPQFASPIYNQFQNKTIKIDTNRTIRPFSTVQNYCYWFKDYNKLYSVDGRIAFMVGAFDTSKKKIVIDYYFLLWKIYDDSELNWVFFSMCYHFFGYYQVTLYNTSFI